MLEKYDLEGQTEVTYISEEINGYLYDDVYVINHIFLCTCETGHGKGPKADPESIIFEYSGYSGLSVNKEGLIQYWSYEK